MKNTILFFFLLLAAAVSAQSNSFVTDRLRAAEYLRIGTNTSQKVTGFDRVITAPGTHDSLPTSRAVVDFLEANFTPIGYYTAGTGISISDDVITNAAPDQVVGLTGSGITVITGTYPNFTITSNEVDGSTTNELQNLSLSGQSLSISSGTGVTLPVVGVSAGMGIGVSGSGGTFTVTNTGDLSATNEIQTLSLSGSDLSLSLGGGTVTLPGGADGNGIYSGSGTIPEGTIASVGANSMRFGDISTFLTDIGSAIGTYSTPQNFELTGYNDGDDGQFGHFFSGKLDDYEAKITYDAYGLKAEASPDNNSTINALYVTGDGISITSADGLGVQYAAEYPDIIENDRSIPDVGIMKEWVANHGGSLGTGFTYGGGAGIIPDGTTATLSTGGSFGDRQIRTVYGYPNYYQENYADGFPFFGFDDYDPNANVTAYAGFSAESAGMFVFGGYDFNTLHTTILGISPNEFNLETHSISESIRRVGGSGGVLYTLSADENGMVFNDNRTTLEGIVGIEYADDYSATIKANARSIPDVGTVNIIKQDLVSYTTTQRNAISSPAAGRTIYCSDCTATDSSTGVTQTYNGSTWKNHW